MPGTTPVFQIWHNVWLKLEQKSTRHLPVTFIAFQNIPLECIIDRGRRGRDLLVVGLTATYTISAYHPGYCDIAQVGGFRRVLWFPPSENLTVTI